MGLAVGAELAANPKNSVVIIEKNQNIGEETSSRNSEVIHAGIYYPKDSLKSKLCIEGNRLIYETPAVESRKVGKWIVAQNPDERQYIEELHKICSEKNISTEFVSEKDALAQEPAIRAKEGALNSPNSGIMSAHSLMSYLDGLFLNRGGEIVFGSEVVGLEKLAEGYKITVDDPEEQIDISSDCVINCAGLHSDLISNMLLPKEKHLKYSYARGNYFTLQGSHPSVGRLIYPTPIKGLKGLGTHLTVSLDGLIKFGPDHELVDKLEYTPNSQNIPRAYTEISRYYPSVSKAEMVASYCGIRPQLPNPKGVFQDFIIREEEGFRGFINMLNIDSPGLTSSMAIGKYVKQLLG